MPRAPSPRTTATRRTGYPGPKSSPRRSGAPASNAPTASELVAGHWCHAIRWPTLPLCCIVAVRWRHPPTSPDRPKPNQLARGEWPASHSDRPTARSHGLHDTARSRGVSRRRDLAASRVLLHQRIRTSSDLSGLADTLMAFPSSRAAPRESLWFCGATAHPPIGGAGLPQKSLVTLPAQSPR